MKTFKQVIGALSRDMLFLHGHIVSIQGLDGAAQRSAYPTTPKKPEPIPCSKPKHGIDKTRHALQMTAAHERARARQPRNPVNVGRALPADRSW